ncbi:hypothetical protein ACO22_07089 [Paracoccidioides brasiliensis]|uniref:Uncharacterized protein n=1 Tax=Paracoccidioides brasiliensis TaxID=121759 RepID=A0A1D2J5P4_PARBR|nr:hypothetical protein ACO22_07089 [Paracoccidioides brasiliensis]
MESRVQELLAELEKERRLREEERTLQEIAETQRSSDDDVKKQKQIQSQQHCHNSFTPVMSFLLAIRIVTDPTRTTQGAVTKPANQRVPSHITLWDSFIDKQMMVWERLNDNPSFLTEKLFPSKHQLEYVHQLITLITSEWDL